MISRHSVSLLFASLCWGTSFPITEVALRDVSAGVVVFLRFSLGTLLLFLLFRRRPHFERHSVAAGVFNAFAFGLQFIGQQFTTATKVAVLSNTFPIFTVALSPFILSERPTPRQVLSVVLGVGGITLVGNLSDLKGVNPGDVMNVMAALLYAFYMVVSKKALERVGILDFVITSGLVSSLFALTYLPVFFRVELTSTAVFSVLWLVLIPSVLGYLLYAYGISGKSAISSSVLVLSTVLFGAMTSTLFLKESLSPTESFGLLLITLAILLSA